MSEYPEAITGTWSDLERQARYVFETADELSVERDLAEGVLVLLGQGVERAESLAETLHTILDPSYVGNYGAAEVVEIYRKWAKTALERDDSRAALSQPEEAL